MDNTEEGLFEDQGGEDLDVSRVGSSDSLNDMDDMDEKSRDGWSDMGSYEEIVGERIQNSRDFIQMRFSKKRKFFGRITQHTTTDSGEHYRSSDSVDDPKYSVKKIEREFGVQNKNPISNALVQTQRFRKVNNSTQIEKPTLESLKQYEKDESYLKTLFPFLVRVEPLFKDALKQCEMLPLFEDDFANLGQADSFIGRKSSSMIKERQSFTHLEYSKNRMISCIDMQPNSKGIVAFSCLNSSSFNSYVRDYGKSRTSYVIIWNIADPIYAQTVLTSPSDVVCIRFHPTDPNLIVGGCMNGQVVLWDLNEKDKNTKYSIQQDLSRDHVKTLKWKQISFVESSHKTSVNDIQWLPVGKEFGRYGEIRDMKPITPKLGDLTNKSTRRKKQMKSISSSTTTVKGLLHNDDGEEMFPSQKQFFSIGADGKLLAWDIRIDHLRRGFIAWKKKNEKIRDAWIPYNNFSMIHHSDLSEVTGSRFVFDCYHPQIVYCTSQDGDVIVCDWSKQQKGSGGGGGANDGTKSGPTSPRQGGGSSHHNNNNGGTSPVPATPRIEESKNGGSGSGGNKFDKSKNIVEESLRSRDGAHFGASNSIDMHPLFENYFLTVGDWSFKIWKIDDEEHQYHSKNSNHENQQGEENKKRKRNSKDSKTQAKLIWSSPYSQSLINCGLWSPTRPSVVFLGREDGNIEVWDFMDKSFEPSMPNFVVSQGKITSMKFKKIVGKTRTLQYLAVGSSVGTLHIIDIPMNLIRQGNINEEENFKEFLEREEKKTTYYKERWKLHSEKFEMEKERRNRKEMDSDEELEFEMEERKKNKRRGGGGSSKNGKNDDDNEEEEEEEDIFGENDNDENDEEEIEIEEIDYAAVAKKFKEDLKKFTEDPSFPAIGKNE